MKMILSIYSFEDGKMLAAITRENLSDRKKAEYNICDFKNLYNEDVDMKYDLINLIEDSYPDSLGFSGFFFLKDEEEILGVWYPHVGFSYFGVAEYDERVRIKRLMPHLTCDIIGE